MSGRKFLLMKLVCSRCGSNLELSYDRPRKTDYEEGEPTGADMVATAVAVEPCRCVTARLDEMQQAANVLLGTKP